jgi:hypothetical protein
MRLTRKLPVAKSSGTLANLRAPTQLKARSRSAALPVTLVLALGLFAAGYAQAAGVSAPAQLLPPDTLAVLSLPDADKAAVSWNESAYGKLWQDPALKPFRDRVVEKWTEHLAAPLQRQLGIKLTEYLDMAHGQLTLAITRNGWGSRPDARPGVLILVDSKDKQELVKIRLEELKKKWTDAGKGQKSEKIRGIDFTTFVIADQDWSRTIGRAFPGGDEDEAAEENGEPAKTAQAGNKEITFGQSGSLLLVSNDVAELERVLARQSGSMAGSLAESSTFQASQNSLFRDAVGLAWVNVAPIYEVIHKQLRSASESAAAGNPFAIRPDKVLEALGLSEVKTIAARLRANAAEGTFAEVFVSIPEARRKGLFRLLALERRESGPPAFVGAEVLRFQRWRIDAQKAWTTLESILTSVSPQVAGLIQMGLQAAGKDRDPNFDLKKALIGNLGNDFVRFEKTPRSRALPDLAAPPSLLLIGSGNPDGLLQGIRASTSLMPLAGGSADVKEREFLGRKVYSLTFPLLPTGDEVEAAPAQRSVSFAAGTGYAALSGDVPILEEYLRSAETPPKALREKVGLTEAAQTVGGMNTGLFGYENQTETMRIRLESAKLESAALNKLLSLAPLAGGKGVSAEERKNIGEWFDPSLLPPFERIAKYFHFALYSLSATEDGFSWKYFAPTPPGLN